MQCAQNGGYVFVFSDSHQDPGSAVLEVLARNPEKESVTKVQPGGDKAPAALHLVWLQRGQVWRYFRGGSKMSCKVVLRGS